MLEHPARDCGAWGACLGLLTSGSALSQFPLSCLGWRLHVSVLNFLLVGLGAELLFPVLRL